MPRNPEPSADLSIAQSFSNQPNESRLASSEIWLVVRSQDDGKDIEVKREKPTHNNRYRRAPTRS